MENKAKYYFSIQTTSGVPIYRQITDQIRTQIATGKMVPGIYLPSVRQVAKELEVNPMTVSKAYSLLEKEGVLEYIRGKGMVIRTIAESKEDLQEREEAIVPLLREVKRKASQLSLGENKVVKLLESLWKETEDE